MANWAAKDASFGYSAIPTSPQYPEADAYLAWFASCSSGHWKPAPSTATRKSSRVSNVPPSAGGGDWGELLHGPLHPATVRDTASPAATNILRILFTIPPTVIDAFSNVSGLSGGRFALD